MTGDALHLGLQLVSSDRPLPVIFECLRVAEIIFYLLLNLLADITSSSDGLGFEFSFGQIR